MYHLVAIGLGYSSTITDGDFLIHAIHEFFIYVTNLPSHQMHSCNKKMFGNMKFSDTTTYTVL